MGCICTKKDEKDMIVLDISDNNNHQEDFLKKMTVNSRRDKLEMMNKSQFNDLEDLENCDRTSFASETIKSKKSKI